MRITVFASLLALTFVLPARAADKPWGDGPKPWTVDYAQAKKDARKDNKILLLNFMGDMKTNAHMDKIHHELLLEPAFYTYAKDNGIILVDVVVDADKHGKKRELYESAKDATKDFSVSGYPWILFVSAEGKELGRTGYIPGGWEAYKKLFDQWRAGAASP
jgi:thioredoxin-related protein